MSSPATIHVTEPRNFINGDWRRPASTEFFDVTNPATSELLARTPMSTPADVDAAVQAAAAAFPAWRRTPPGERIRYLFTFRNLLEEHIDELSGSSPSKMGKRLAKPKPSFAAALKTSRLPAGFR